MTVASGATFDLGGISDTIASLGDGVGGGGTVTNNGASTATLTITPPSPTTMSFSGVLQDGTSPLGLTLTGPSLLVLTGNNTYSGVTTINGGTLQIGNGGYTGSIGNTSGILDNGVLAFNRADTVTLATSISGNGGLTQMGPGTLIVAGAGDTYTGPTLISGGTLRVGPYFTSGPSLPAPSLHYTMAGVSGNAINPGDPVLDSSGNGINATMNNGGASYVAAPTGTAIQFTASNRTLLGNGATEWGTGGQYLLTSGAGAALSSLNSWTESVWINMPAADSGVTMYFTDARGTGSYGFDQSFNNGGETMYTRIEQAGGGWVYTGGSNFTIPTGTWALLTTTVGAGVYNIYLDGVLVGGATYGGTAQFMDPGQEFVIGGHANGGAYPFNGSVGDFTIYDVALTQAQILAAYQAIAAAPASRHLVNAKSGTVGQRGGPRSGRLQPDDPLAVQRRPQRRHGDQQCRRPGNPHPGARRRLDDLQRRHPRW